MLALAVAGLLPLMSPLPALAGDDGYRLLELNGYKVKWGDRRLGVGARVSYAFARETLRFDDARNCGDLAPIDALLDENLSLETLVRETAAAFRVWESAAGLSFHEVGDARHADIILGAQGQPRGRAYANVSYAPDPIAHVSYAPDSAGGIRSIERSLVCLNPEHKWKVGFDGDENAYDIRYTMIHEIGHAIGLDHPGPSGQMMGFRYGEAFRDLQPGDLRGVQRLYGRAADDRGPPDGIETHWAEGPTEVDGAYNLLGYYVTNTAEEAIGSANDLLGDQNASNLPVMGVSVLGIGEK
jgi:hypothetical protein